MSIGYKRVLFAIPISALLIAHASHATNGYFSHGYSTKEKGLAGAGVAYSQDALSVATNPAGLVQVGDRLELGAAIFSPSRQYTVTGAPSGPAPYFPLSEGRYISDNDYFFIPSIAWSKNLDETSSFGLAAYGNGGMNSSYSDVPGGGTFYGGTTGVDLTQLFINASYARQIGDKHSLGASLIFSYQQFKAEGLGAFGANGFSVDQTKLTNNDYDTSTGFGVKIGWQGQITPTLALGASYQSKMSMSELDEYVGLYAEGGDFDIPATSTLGLAWDLNNNRKLLVDIQTIYYGDVASIANSMSKLTEENNLLGSANGPGFGWEDMTIVKVGYQWMQKDVTWRLGLSHGSQPIPESEVMFNILAPGVIENHITFGFTVPMGEKAELDFTGMYAPTNSVSGTNPMDPNQTIELEMDQKEIQVTYAIKF